MWSDLVSLFGEEGASDGCWCMSWRSSKELDSTEAKAELKKLVDQEKVNGILIYDKNLAIGWTSYGPRKEFPNADNHPDFKQLDSLSYSIPCFFIKENYRGKAIAAQLLDAAIVAAKKDGATTLESYPVKASESADVKEDWSFTGSRKMFEIAGFKSCVDCKYELDCLRKKL